jgi:hypothetical protein
MGKGSGEMLNGRWRLEIERVKSPAVATNAALCFIPVDRTHGALAAGVRE